MKDDFDVQKELHRRNRARVRRDKREARSLLETPQMPVAMPTGRRSLID